MKKMIHQFYNKNSNLPESANGTVHGHGLYLRKKKMSFKLMSISILSSVTKLKLFCLWPYEVIIQCQ